MKILTVTARDKVQFERSLEEIYKQFGYDNIEILGSGIQNVKSAINLHAIILVKNHKEKLGKVSTSKQD